MDLKTARRGDTVHIAGASAEGDFEEGEVSQPMYYGAEVRFPDGTLGYYLYERLTVVPSREERWLTEPTRVDAGPRRPC